MRRLLNIKQTSEYVGLSPNEIRRRILAETFPFVNISKGDKAVYRFDLKELEKYIDCLPGKTTDDSKIKYRRK